MLCPEVKIKAAVLSEILAVTMIAIRSLIVLCLIRKSEKSLGYLYRKGLMDRRTFTFNIVLCHGSCILVVTISEFLDFLDFVQPKLQSSC